MSIEWIDLLILITFGSTGLSTIKASGYCTTLEGVVGECVKSKNCLIDSYNPKRLSYDDCGYSENEDLLICCPVNYVVKILTEARLSSSFEDDVLLKPPRCGFSNGSLPRIIGEAVKGFFPWSVALGYRSKHKAPRWLCEGSLITYKHVLTAGHCVFNRRDLYLARVGEIHLKTQYSENDVEIGDVKLHEKFNPKDNRNDIAILTLQRNVDSLRIRPICLPVAEPLKSRILTHERPLVIGWGSFNLKEPTSNNLEISQLPVVENQICRRAFKGQVVVNDNILCAGFIERMDSVCLGGSGSPWMFGEQSNNGAVYYQIGIMSYGFDCTRTRHPVIFTRVSKYTEWIEKHIKFINL